MQYERQKEMPAAEVLAGLKEEVGYGGSAAEWLARAYVSWYRGGASNQIDLRGYGSLDARNKLLFREMLGLRSRSGWSDDELWQAEKHMLAALEEMAEE